MDIRGIYVDLSEIFGRLLCEDAEEMRRSKKSRKHGNYSLCLLPPLSPERNFQQNIILIGFFSHKQFNLLEINVQLI